MEISWKGMLLSSLLAARIAVITEVSGAAAGLVVQARIWRDIALIDARPVIALLLSLQKLSQRSVDDFRPAHIEVFALEGSNFGREGIEAGMRQQKTRRAALVEQLKSYQRATGVSGLYKSALITRWCTSSYILSMFVKFPLTFNVTVMLSAVRLRQNQP